MKRFIAVILVAFVVASLVPCSVFATEGNLDGVGGTLGKALNNWYVITAGSGARITVVTEGEEQIGESFDWLNSSPFGSNVVHFGKYGKLSKLKLRGVRNVNELLGYKEIGGYAAEIKSDMPQIVKASGSNISYIRSYFTDNGVIATIANRVGASFTYGAAVNVGGREINGMYVVRNGVPVKCCIVVEPIVSISCGGTPIVCTATELKLTLEKTIDKW